MIPTPPGAVALVPPEKADALFSSIAKAKGADWFSLRISTPSGRRARGEALRRIPFSREGKPARVSEQDFGFTLDVKPTVRPRSGGALLDLEMVPRWVQFEGLMEGSAQPVTSRFKTEFRISLSSGDAAVLVLSEAKGGKQAELLVVRARIAPNESWK